MVRAFLACTVLLQAVQASPFTSAYVEVGEVEAVLSLLQIGPPVLYEKSSKESTEEALLQLARTSSRISGSLGGALLLAAVVLACCCCPVPSLPWASAKDSPTEILPPVSDKKNPPSSQRSASSSNCCGGGICSLLRPARRAEKEEQPRPNSPLQGERTKGFVPAPPEEYLTADAHVNFSGDWKCKEADGDLDAVFADMGIGFIPRRVMAGFGWGKGHVVRSYEQSGNHVKVTERAIQETVQEFDAIGEEQRVNGGDFDFLQTTYWDPQKPHVLRWKGVDLERANPKQWTRTCQFFLDKDHLRIETTSSSEKTAWWIYERERVS